jgi:hypothetical protein
MVFYSEDYSAALKAAQELQKQEHPDPTIGEYPLDEVIQAAINAAERNRHGREVEAKQPLFRIELAGNHRNARANAVDELTVKQGRQVLEQIANERREMAAREIVLKDIESSLNNSLGYQPRSTPSGVSDWDV